MKKYIIGENFSSGRATFYRDHSDQTVNGPIHSVLISKNITKLFRASPLGKKFFFITIDFSF